MPVNRAKSVVTAPGYHKGRIPENKGRRLPAEELSRDEIKALEASFNPKQAYGIRDRAIFSLMYRVGLKVVQIERLERRDYRAGSDHLTIVPVGRWRDRNAGRRVRLDTLSLEALNEWLEARRRLGVGPAAPLFCGTRLNDGLGRAVQSTSIRATLRRHAARLGIEKRVAPEGLRLSGRNHRQGTTMERQIESYLDEEAFERRYPEAFAKWREARDLYSTDAERHTTRIGHDCREAMMDFASALAVRHNVSLDALPSHTIPRIRAVLDKHQAALGKGVAAFAQALLAYWGTVNDLAQRQEHAAAREGEPLDAEDARRLVFQTMLVMYELDRTLSRVRAGPVDPARGFD